MGDVLRAWTIVYSFFIHTCNHVQLSCTTTITYRNRLHIRRHERAWCSALSVFHVLCLHGPWSYVRCDHTRSNTQRSVIWVGSGSDEECSEVHNSPWTVSICILYLFKFLSRHRCPWMLVYVAANALAMCSVVWTPCLLFNACQFIIFAHNSVAWRVCNSCSYVYIVTVFRYVGLWHTRHTWTCCRAVVSVVAHPLCEWIMHAIDYLHETVLGHPLNLSISLSGGGRTK